MADRRMRIGVFGAGTVGGGKCTKNGSEMAENRDEMVRAVVACINACT